MHEYKTSGKEERMEKNDQKNRQKSDYEAPKIKEEIVLEQKALACTAGHAGKANKDCTKSPTTHGSVWS